MDCLYCEHGEKMNSFTYHICDLSVSELYLNQEQSYPGRCILLLKRHAEEYFELTAEERVGLQEDLYKTTKALETVYHPDKINMGVYGDTVRHFHIHVVPKYKGGLDWNGIFQMNANKVYPSTEDLAQTAEKIRSAILKF